MSVDDLPGGKGKEIAIQVSLASSFESIMFILYYMCQGDFADDVESLLCVTIGIPKRVIEVSAMTKKGSKGGSKR